jgi:TolA-binding protein
MRFLLLTAVLLAGTASNVVAQPRETTERRLERIEQELRAVQRRVFPGGAQVAPEIEPAAPAATQPATSGGSAVGDLTARLDSVEAQLAALTGAVEENGNRTRQIEAALTALREENAARLARLEAAAAPPAAAPVQTAATRPAEAAPSEPRTQAPATATPAPAATTPAPAAAPDAAEEAYNAGFRLWEARRFEEAQAALQAVAERYPRSRWASWASNLAGRAFLDDNKPATAARIFLANYQGNPQGERAADSLYFLGQSLVALNRRPEACRVYDELAQVYPNMRDWIRTRLPEARRAARCTG